MDVAQSYMDVSTRPENQYPTPSVSKGVSSYDLFFVTDKAKKGAAAVMRLYYLTSSTDCARSTRP